MKKPDFGRTVLFFVIVVLITLTLKTCKKGEEKIPVTDTSGVSVNIGTSGGILEVKNTASPMYGVKIEIPEGALNTNTNISINIQSIEPTCPEFLKKVSTMISLSPENIIFNVPVIITIPFDVLKVLEKDKLGVYTYNNEISSWIPLTIMDIRDGTIKALTQHFSTFQVAEYTKPLNVNGDTGFKPTMNGFALMNFGDDSDSGHCWGMVAYAAWYYEYKQPDINLSAKYSACEARSIINETYHTIAEIRPDFITWKLYQSAGYVANALMMGIDLKRPQPLSLFTNKPPGHAVLVYKYVKNSDLSVMFYIYDPNYPADNNKFIIYRNGKLEPYESFNEFQCVGGLSSLPFYEKIYNLEMMPKIENTLPTGIIKFNRPTISAAIKSPSPYSRKIKTSKIQMTLDNKAVSPTFSESGSEVNVSYSPAGDLINGDHTVSLSGCDVEDIETCSTAWTFKVDGNSSLIVHGHNPEGKEIGMISGFANSVKVFDGSSSIGYADGITPITITSGHHAISVKFNGMTLVQEIDLVGSETPQELIFEFTRTTSVWPRKSGSSKSWRPAPSLSGSGAMAGYLDDIGGLGVAFEDFVSPKIYIQGGDGSSYPSWSNTYIDYSGTASIVFSETQITAKAYVHFSKLPTSSIYIFGYSKAVYSGMQVTTIPSGPQPSGFENWYVNNIPFWTSSEPREIYRAAQIGAYASADGINVMNDTKIDTYTWIPEPQNDDITVYNIPF